MSRDRAIIVGVEQYSAGWKLDGPASDACRFATILLDRGVPRESITLLVNPLPDNVATVQACGLEFGEPDRATVTRVLRTELAADRADRLYFFWGGHGVVDADDNRRLFYSDAEIADKRNLDFTDFLTTLRTMKYPALRHQFLVVDACQSFAAQLQSATTLPQDHMAKGAPAAGRDQHVLFAASPGQVALNDTANKTGAFSREVLKLLADPSTAWPPAADALADRLSDIFLRMRAEKPATQTPTYLWHKTPLKEGRVATSAEEAAETAGRPTLAALSKIVDRMVREDELSDAFGVRKIIQLMPAELRGAIPYDDVARTYVLRWLRAAIDQRAAIIAALDTGVANPDARRRVLDAFDEHWPLGGTP